MKTKINNGKFLPMGKASANQMKKWMAFLFILFICVNANAQTAPVSKMSGKLSGQAPASNLRGPLKAYVNGGNIVVTSEIESDVKPTVTYSLVNNTSGATIVSQGTLVYNAATDVMTQTVVVNPGSAKGSFTLRLNASTSAGTCESSKSVTVVNAPVTVNNHTNTNVH